MNYYFIKHATTQVGPINFPVYVVPSGGYLDEDGKIVQRDCLKSAVEDEGRKRGLIICHDWEAEPIPAWEYRRLTGMT